MPKYMNDLLRDNLYETYDTLNEVSEYIGNNTTVTNNLYATGNCITDLRGEYATVDNTMATIINSINFSCEPIYAEKKIDLDIRDNNGIFNNIDKQLTGRVVFSKDFYGYYVEDKNDACSIIENSVVKDYKKMIKDIIIYIIITSPLIAYAIIMIYITICAA